MSKSDLKKETMYEGVGLLLDCPHPHMHLDQQKLYTLFTLAMQYFMYLSSKEKGHYIIRLEDSYLLEKLQRRSKNDIVRKMLHKLALPRRLKYGESVFHLDFFNVSTWSSTNELPREKIKGALVVKNSQSAPLSFGVEDEADAAIIAALPKNHFHSCLVDWIPRSIIIAFDEDYDQTQKLRFPFIKETPRENIAEGVNIYGDVKFLDD